MLSRRLHSWWCPSVNRFTFQACDHASPRTQNHTFPIHRWATRRSKVKKPFTDTAPAESPRALQHSAPGSVVPENARPPVLSPDACKRPGTTISTRIFGTGTSTICFPTCDRSLDNKKTTLEQERVPCEIYKGTRPQHVDQVHQEHLQRSPVNKGVQKKQHIKQIQCDCLARFTRRASSNPPLLSLLLRRLHLPLLPPVDL